MLPVRICFLLFLLLDLLFLIYFVYVIVFTLGFSPLVYSPFFFLRWLPTLNKKKEWISCASNPNCFLLLDFFLIYFICVLFFLRWVFLHLGILCWFVFTPLVANIGKNKNEWISCASSPNCFFWFFIIRLSFSYLVYLCIFIFWDVLPNLVNTLVGGR